MNDQQSYWLIIEPYVHISLTSKNVLFYNTLDSSLIESSEPEVIEISEKLLNAKNRYCVLFTENDFKSLIKVKMIDSLRDKFMGDIIPITLSKSEPAQLSPILNIQSDKISKQFNRKIKIDKELKYLHELNFFVNEFCTKDCLNCTDMYKQFKYCKNTNRNCELSLCEIIRVLKEVESSSLCTLNFFGGNLLMYSEFDKLIELFGKTNYSTNLYVNIENVDKTVTKGNSNNLKWIFLIDLSREFEAVRLKINESLDNGLNGTYTFIVSSYEEVEKAETLINDCKIENFDFRPFYNKENIEFFYNEVYLTKADVLENIISMKEIFKNRTINSCFFGVLNVDNNGDVYADLNANPVGNIFENSINECIYNEISLGESWFRIRNKGKCSDCLYKDLCPPLSNYETVLNKENLCCI